MAVFGPGQVRLLFILGDRVPDDYSFRPGQVVMDMLGSILYERLRRGRIYDPDSGVAEEATPETYVEDVNSSIQHVIAERNAHYDFSLFRLINSDDTRHNPRLIIRNHETGHTIVNIDLCYYLALARNAYEIQNYSPQEYLDREYDYRLDFGIEGSGSEETWKYVTISINVLSWAIRIQNEEL